VTAAKLKKSAVSTTKIADKAVNGSKIADGSVTGADINPSTLGTVPNATNVPQPLAAPIPVGNAEWLREGETSASCPGVGRAAPNHLCLYDNEESSVDLCCIYDFALNEPAADKNGFIVYWEPNEEGSYVSGQWTVTAP
jgi:hypothetical protein